MAMYSKYVVVSREKIFMYVGGTILLLLMPWRLIPPILMYLLGLYLFCGDDQHLIENEDEDEDNKDLSMNRGKQRFEKMPKKKAS